MTLMDDKEHSGMDLCDGEGKHKHMEGKSPNFTGLGSRYTIQEHGLNSESADGLCLGEILFLSNSAVSHNVCGKQSVRWSGWALDNNWEWWYALSVVSCFFFFFVRLNVYIF